jgi:glyoxylase-like metal-dependent hydrolase (beta-lactamase superfamily II)/ferredoxin
MLCAMIEKRIRRAAMADLKKKVEENVAGEFFVDRTCIDCDTCRQLAPGVFAEAAMYSYVHSQPRTADETRAAIRALLACPVGSIGTLHHSDARSVMDDFPMPIEGPVYYCGFSSADSYGATSYFIRHPAGNWLVDSPRSVAHLVRRFEQMGGIRYIFLTHRDDVARAAQFARRFGAARIIHREDLSAQPGAELVIDGFEPIEVVPDFKIIPTPGHSPGHCVLLHAGRYLFTGDHLWWSAARRRLDAYRMACWHSWEEQTESMERLAGETFEWVLPGHGGRVCLPAGQMRREVAALAARMRT